MINVKFEPRDVYVGIYWNVVNSTKNNKETEATDDYVTNRTLYVYVHVLPFVRITISKKLKPVIGIIE